MTKFVKYESQGDEEITSLQSSEGRIYNKNPIEVGSERGWGHQKSYTELVIQRGERQKYAGTYVIKEFEEKSLAMYELQKVLELEEAGVPVPPTHRYAYDSETGKHILLYSDLTEGGRHKIWSNSNTHKELVDLGITEEEFGYLIESLADISNRASKAKYILNSDAYFIRRKDTGALDVVIGDIGIGVYNSSSEGAIKTNRLELKDITNDVRAGVI